MVDLETRPKVNADCIATLEERIQIQRKSRAACQDAELAGRDTSLDSQSGRLKKLRKIEGVLPHTKKTPRNGFLGRIKAYGFSA